MSEQQKKDPISPSRGQTVDTTSDAKPEAGTPAPASTPQALLQAAVKAAQEKAGPKVVEAQSEAPEIPPAIVARAARRFPLQAAGFALVLGLGWVGGWATFATLGASAQSAAPAADWRAIVAGLEQSQADALRFAGDVRALKGGIESLTAAVDRSKQETATKLAQLAQPKSPDPEIAAKLASLAERLDRIPLPDPALVAGLAKAAERMEQAEGAGRETGTRLAQIAERLERIERHAAAKPAPAPAAAVAAIGDGPTQTGSVTEAKPKPATVEGWVLRDVYNGLALVEGKNQRLFEIGAGDNVPGIGRVEAIERRGKSWVVVTSKGIISSQQW